jgi:Transient receptor potential (TRP) ion channel
MQKDRFYDFRSGWKTVLKGVMFRLVLVGYTQMSLLCLWELTQRDSIGAVVNAVLMFLTMTALLFFASYRVIRLARRSISLHQSAAYILYSDPQQLNRWGFLYVQFRADAYYYILPLLVYAVLKGALIAFMQPVGTAMVHLLQISLISGHHSIRRRMRVPWVPVLDPPIHEQTNKRLCNFHRRHQCLQHAPNDLLLQRLQSPRSRKRYPRRSMVCRQRSLRPSPPNPRHNLLCLRLRLQRPRNPLPTHARRPLLLHAQRKRILHRIRRISSQRQRRRKRN